MRDLELDLIEKAIKGDLSSFENIVKKYENKVYNILLRILGHEEDAKDLCQEVFIKVYKNLPGFKGQSKFYTWLYRISVNAAKDFLRKKDKNTSYENTSEDVNSPYDLENPASLYDKKEKENYILNALLTLSEEHRTIVVLRDIQVFSYQEISEILDISMGTVKSRINRGRRELRQKLLDGSYPFEGRGQM